jgi:hypothetical protein
MTTIFSVNHSKENVAVLGGDRQLTYTEENRMGTYSEKHLGSRKLWTSDDGTFAFGYSGIFDPDLETLVNDMKSGKINLAEVVKSGGFEELRNLNIKRLGRKLPDPNKQGSFLMRNRDGKKTGLYTCFPYGDVEPRDWTWIGSGSKKVEEYTNALSVQAQAKGYLPEVKLTGEDAIRMVAEGVRYAQTKDIYSSGMDLIFMTPEKTVDCFDILQEDFATKIKAIQDKIK